MSRGERQLAALFAAGLCGFVAFGWWQGRRAQAFAQRQTLPDGSVVELRAVTFGKAHRCVYGAFWQRFLRKIVPAPIAGRIRGVEIVQDTPKEALVFWIAHQQLHGNFFWDRTTLAVAINERGAEGEFGDWPASFRGKADELNGVALAAFDRRGKTIGLRLYQRADNRWKRVAEFKVPNPAYGVFPTWTPEPLPITRTNGDLAVTLTGAAVGVFVPGFAPDSWKVEQTRLGFRFAQNGQPTSAWEPVEYFLSDATGNTRDDWQYTMDDEKNGDTGRILPGAFTPQESAWKLRVGVARTAAATFSPAELWTVRGVLLSTLEAPLDPRTPFHTNGTTVIQGVRLQLVNRIGRELRGVSEPVIEVHVSPPRPDLTVSLIRAIDNSNRPATNATTGLANNRGNFFFAGWKFPEQATALDLTFAIHQTRYFDFMVQPAVVASNRFLGKP